MKKERMTEVLRLKKKDEDVCSKMGLDPFHMSTTVVPSTSQLEALKDHIRCGRSKDFVFNCSYSLYRRSMEEEKFDREENYVTMKDAIMKRYSELEEEPESEFERFWSHLLQFFIFPFRLIACEDTEAFVLSTANLEQVKSVLKMLDDIATKNQKTTLDAIEKIESLYERLKLDSNEKYQFLSMHQVT